MAAAARDEMIKRLELFIGNWKMEVIHPHFQPSPITGHTRFDWLEGKYVIQRTQINKSEFPSSTSIYDWDATSGQYVMHYFDSRGVTRLSQMTLENGIWKWWRDTADFSPLNFFQRFTGEIDEPGKIIQSILESSNDGINWEHDLNTADRRE